MRVHRIRNCRCAKESDAEEGLKKNLKEASMLQGEKERNFPDPLQRDMS